MNIWKVIGVVVIAIIFVQCKNNNNIPARFNPRIYQPLDSSINIVSRLPDIVGETSGLVYFDGQLWTHNDSGDDPVLYQINEKTGELIRKVIIDNAQHEDWEDIAQDSTHIYIGDFGNNMGNRQDLTIYKVQKQALGNPNASATPITFRYADQQHFYNIAYRHNFDCEAMVVIKDSIYLFSKNHQNKRTRIYSLPTTEGDYTLTPRADFNVKGLITGGDMNTSTGELNLIGYILTPNNSYIAFAWIFPDFDKQKKFTGNSQMLYFPYPRQIEGICHRLNGKRLLSCEYTEPNSGLLFEW